MILLEVNNEVLFIIAITVAMLLVIAFFTVYIFFLFQKRKTRLLQQQQALKETYEKEILKTQIEIRDQAMNDVGRELHDHISQLLTLIKLNMSQLSGLGLNDAGEKRLAETKDLMKTAIDDVRMLSKTLNSELILQTGLEESIRHELERINRLNLITCRLQVHGEPFAIQPNTAFIIFRILQENLHNILKHARCKEVHTQLEYTDNSITLTQRDDGMGFDYRKQNTGSGLINMQRRAALINANLQLSSDPGKGSTLRLELTKDA